AVVRPTTLVTVAGRVYAVAESARYVAWRGCDSVGVGDVSGHRFPAIRVPKSAGFGCQLLYWANFGLIDHDILAILDGTVTWSKWGYGNSTDYASFGAAQITSGHSVRSVLPSNLWASDQGEPAGSYIVGPVSDGRDLLYGVTKIRNDRSCTEEQASDGTCPLATSGTVWRVDSKLQRHPLTAAAATFIAFSGGRVALVPHAEGQPPDLGLTGRLFRQPEATVLLLRLADGTRIGSVDLAGEPYELALSAQLGAVLVGERAKNPRVHITTPAQLQWFDPRHGGSAESLTVAADAEALSVAGNRIIFRQGRRILSYSPGDSKPTLVAQGTPGSTITGPVLSGTRLVWAETSKQGGRLVSRIRTLTLSGS
ncbi:MAG TPA: hypothetical protein VNH40_14070, partial [Gaiellaceae bacterium]|nr:hypothetical protein [Gaiellaceae bacterium]